MVDVLRVTVDPPALDGDTVTFTWRQSTPNPFQRVNTFFFRYEGIETTHFSRELYYEIFLGLQLRVFAGYSGRVELVFPSPVPRPTVDYWRAFNHAEQVEITPIAEVDSFAPWVERPHTLPRSRKVAVFFGGGKDSTLAACLFSELEGADEVVLVQFVSPLRQSAALEARLTERQTSLMLEPAGRRLGVATQRAWTDFQAQFLPDGYHLRPNLELYTLGALPALLTWGVNWCTFSIPWTMYPTQRQRGGRIKYRYERSRPEELANQSRHYRRAFGAPITVTNITLPFSSYLTFRFLAERYPQALQGINSCTKGGVSERWCYRCEKCWATMLWSLASGAPLAGFDYDVYLRDSPFTRDLETYARSGVELTVQGNAPWQPFISSERGYDMVCHMVARLAEVELPPDLSREARANLALLRALFGNRLVPEYDAVPVRFLELLGADMASRLTPLVAEHFAVTDGIPAPSAPGFDYEFDGSFVPRTSAVAHLKEDGC